tara:strand:+ start:962 stop:1195 length:234 start_codon:yes stop_codon:yes gene_type:complete
MTDASKEIIIEYKDQVRLLREENAELMDAGKTKDASTKRCLQKLENLNEDLVRANTEIQELKDKLKDLKEPNKVLEQ